MAHQYSEKELPYLKAKTAFPLTVVLLIGVVIGAKVLQSLALQTFWPDVAFLIACCVLVYVLYRYAAMTHIYTLSGTEFCAERAGGLRRKLIFSVEGGEVRLICPLGYEGKRIPRGAFTRVYATGMPRKRLQGWAMYATYPNGDRRQLLFHPSDELIRRLAEAFPHKMITEQSDLSEEEI